MTAEPAATTDHPSTGTVEVPAPDEVHDDGQVRWTGSEWEIVAPSVANPDRAAFVVLPAAIDGDGPNPTADELRQLAGQALAAAYLLDHGHLLNTNGWLPIEKDPPNRYGGRTWRCRNHRKPVSNTVWGGAPKLKATLIRHMTLHHPGRPWLPEVADLDEQPSIPDAARETER